MVIAFCLLIVFSIIVTAFFFQRSYHPYSDSVVPVSFRTILFSLWLVASAMWPRGFFEQRIAGLFDITVDRILLIFLSLALIAGFLTGSPNPRARRTIELLFFLFCVICISSMLIHGFGRISIKYISPWYVFITAYLFPFVGYLFAKKYLVYENDLSFLFQALFYMGVYLGIMAFFEFFNLRQYVHPSFINNPKLSLHLERARGPFINAAFNGFLLIIGFICGAHLLAFKRGFSRILHLILMTIFFPAVFFTLTRSIYLCFLVTLLTLLFAYRTPFPKWKLLALPLALVMAIAVMNLPRLASTERRAGGIYQVQEVVVRQALLKRSLIMVLDNPIFGLGLAQFIPASVAKYKGLAPIPETYEEQTQHNQLLGLTAELGLVGVSVYLSIIIVFFKRVYSLFVGLPKTGFIDSNLALLIGLAMGVYMLNNFFVDSSFHLFPNAVFFAFGGLADGLYGRLQEIRSSDEGTVPLRFSPSYGA